MPECHKCFLWSFFFLFGEKTEVYKVNLLTQPNKKKYGPQKSPNLDIWKLVNPVS